ncbi:MAG: hypothetical protein MR821_12175, partial [Clostridiales bacterium]|nr:hypothetical protein [Clostridiales bacterium]
MSQKTTKAKKKKHVKPLRRAQRWGGQVLPMAGKLLAITLASVVVGLMFSALQMIESLWLRALISLAILSGVLLMHFSEGL